MTATTIPEEIGPSSLLAYTGNDFYTVNPGGAPNGDDSLLLTTDATTATLTRRQQAFQPASETSHLLPLTANAMSFWIKRRASFSANVGISTGSTGSTITSALPLIMGVGRGIGAIPDGTHMSWGMWSNGASTVQFGVHGHTVNTMYGSGSVTLATDIWHFMVVNSEARSNGNDGPGRWEIFQDGSLQTVLAPAAVSGYYLDTSWIPVSEQRFVLGDPTQGAQAATAAATSTPLLEIAKLTFHNQNLSSMDILNMMESMKYGGAAA